MASVTPPVFRFAPSPNGALHLGHAYSALLNQKIAQETGGTLLLRIEDIDTARCTPDLEEEMLADLEWLGIEWLGEPRRQSEHFSDYRTALEKLQGGGLVYPAFMSRAEIRRAVAGKSDWPWDPEGQPHYPGNERSSDAEERNRMIRDHERYAWRLDTNAALAGIEDQLDWHEWEGGTGSTARRVPADPSVWGDVVLARSDTSTSYHLSVVIDDALQGITHAVRGKDLFEATAIHRLLQELLGLPRSLYYHHNLILAEDGRKLSKSSKDTSLKALREAGYMPADIRRMVGL